jgi:hypothetical protein
MRCCSPLQAYYYIRPDGKKDLKFVSSKCPRKFKQYRDILLDVPCGQCINCRLRRSADWATRVVKELGFHDMSCFLTLTYDDDHLPSDNSLVKKDLQKFFKRLRKRCEKSFRYSFVRGDDLVTRDVSYPKLSYFAVGEYGDRTERPHYHVILFGLYPHDFKYYKDTSTGEVLYTSEWLTDIWQHGHVVVGDVSFESAAYCARYCLKKVTGKDAEEHYAGRVPEFSLTSKGIGKAYYEKFASQVYAQDAVVVRGHKRTPPRYFDLFLALDDEDKYKAIKDARIVSMAERRGVDDEDRLRTEGIVQEAKMNFFKRDLK